VGAKEHDEFRGAKTFDIHRLAQARRSTVTVKYVPQDAEGNWGIVETLTFVDETWENEIHAPRVIKELGAKTLVKFAFPTSEAGFVTACRSFFESTLDNRVVDAKQLRQLVMEILDTLNGSDTE
jgi:hypothetical protein